jgi:hypothetical protein
MSELDLDALVALAADIRADCFGVDNEVVSLCDAVPALTARVRELEAASAVPDADEWHATFGTPDPPQWVLPGPQDTAWTHGYREGYTHGRRTNAAALTVTTTERDEACAEVARLRAQVDDLGWHAATLIAQVDAVTALCRESSVHGVTDRYPVVHVNAVLAALATGAEPCTCGYGGFHEPENHRCERNIAAARIVEGK